MKNMNSPQHYYYTFSVVTVSYNQADFLEQCILSVVSQVGPKVEYIVVDPGSTDDSRSVIARYNDQISWTVLEPDEGAADGLNKGFSRATGDIFCYINSDDEFLPGAFASVSEFFLEHPEVDVVCGHAWVVDENGRRLRRVWSDPFSRLKIAYGSAIQIQPSTFIRREAFIRCGGFNPENRSNWDGELMISLFNSGATFGIFDRFCSLYRVHELSITGSGKAHDMITEWNRQRFLKLIGRKQTNVDHVLTFFFRGWRVISHPIRSMERLKYGRVYRRKAK